MRINFPIVTLPHITFSKPQNSSSALKPLPFDTFERISFTKSSPVTPIQHGGCATSNFEIKNIPNLHCPVCGLLMLTDEQVEEFVQDVQHKRGYDLIKALEKYEDESVFTGVKSNPPKSIYRPLKQEIVDIIKDLAAQHESASLSELVQMEARNRIDSLIASQMAVMRELEQYVKSSNATRNEKEYIYNILSSFKREILGEGDNKFARKRFLHAVKEVASDKTTQKKITEIASKLPTSERDVNSWFVKYSQPLKSQDIAYKLVRESIPSADHLQPKSKGGANSLKNYLCDCADCNSKRGDMDFYDWSKTIPNFKENLQEYLQDVQDAVDEGRLEPKYSTYIDNIIETIRRLSKDEILLDPPNSKDGLKRMKMLQKREAKIADLTKSLKELTRKRTDLKKLIDSLEETNYYQHPELNEQILQSTRVRLAALNTALSNMARIEEQMSRVKAQVDQEDGIRIAMDELALENKNLEAQNQRIKSSKQTNLRDKKDYELYQHKIDVLADAYTLPKRLKNQKGNKRAQRDKDREVINVAIDALKSEIAQLLQIDSVIYFVNEDRIKENKVHMAQLEKQIQSIEHKKQLMAQYGEELRKAGSNRTREQLEKEYQELLQRVEILENIKKLPEIRTEYQGVSDIVAHNRDIITNLRLNYEYMTSSEFAAQAGLVY